MTSYVTPHIRPALAQDESTIRALISQEHLDRTSLKWQNFLVAEDEAGRVIGIGQIKQLPGACELGSLVVVDEWRGRGVAGALIHALMAQERGPLYLLGRDNRVPYYEKFGFRIAAWRDLPWIMRIRWLFPQAFRLFGVRIVAMHRPSSIVHRPSV